LQIGIVGAGKVGTTLGKIFSDAGIGISGYFSRTYEHAAESAAFTQSKAYRSLHELINASDMLFITVPDSMIRQVWEEITGLLQQSVNVISLMDKVICHFSGSLSSDVFENADRFGAYRASFHPVFAFSDKFHSYQQFHNVFVVGEGDPAAVERLKGVFSHTDVNILIPEAMQSGDVRAVKSRYHMASVFASNLMIGLMETAVECLETSGFSRNEAFKILKPLAEVNLESFFKNGPANALTGPIERGDAGTVKKHLDSVKDLDPQFTAIYKDLSGKVLKIAEEKNPDRDYSLVYKALRDDQ
jgi:predicted short-subunit dehydrogenase-like oxidoreductase (DUF2520 family)